VKPDFNIALSLLREGNSDMIRDLYPKLEPIFDLIDEQSEKIGWLEDHIEELEEVHP
jgi:hypothetical protein